jgi:uncharacterized DUF497 family protein
LRALDRAAVTERCDEAFPRRQAEACAGIISIQYQPMEFEYDPEKSEANRIKHGIDFDEAQALWSDPFLLEAPALTENEPRFIAVGRIGARHWTAIFTWRDERLRIISARRARKKEIERYESP